MTSGALRNVARFIADSFLVPAAMRREAVGLVPTDTDAEKRYREFRQLYSRAIESGRVGERSTAGQTRDQLHRPLLTLFGFETAELRTREVDLDPGAATLFAFGDDSILLDLLPYSQRADDRLLAGQFKGSPHRRLVRALAAGGARYGLILGGSTWRLLTLDTANEPRYLEFDIDAMADGSHIDAFTVMVALVSPTALLGPEPTLAELQAKSDARGIEVSDKLGPAARRSLERLLDGIRADQGNATWAPRVFVEGPELQRIHREGIYVLYRLLFVLFGESAVPPALPIDKPLYRDNYSLERLRSGVTGDPKDFAENTYGLWEAAKALFRLIDRGAQTKEFTVPSYNGGLFAPDRTPLLDLAALNDRAFAVMLRELTTIEMGKGRLKALDQVSFRELGVGQLGAVFEGLLDYEPRIASGDLYETKIGSGKQKGISFLPASALGEIPEEDPTKRFGEFYLQAWGGQRKSTGAYYTPKVIADYLAREALGPQVEGKTPDEILELTVCDPAMGSGGFLVSVTEFLGDAHYRAQVSVGICDPDDERADQDRLASKRLVAEHCVYGVDVNPMAVELAKVSLWLSTLAYDRPLSFFDHHLRCGNSLLSAPLRNEAGELTAKELETVLTAALKDVDREATPNEKTRLKAARTRNAVQLKALEKGRGLSLFSIDLTPPLHKYALQRAELSIDDPTEPASSAAARNRAKERHLRRLTEDVSSPFARIKEICDLWMAPWFWPHNAQVDPPTTDTLRTLQSLIWEGVEAPTALAGTRKVAQEVARDLRFFHWELEFPEVFEGGGFHAIVGNPPWETLSPKTQEFFSNVDVRFRTYTKQAALELMKRLREDQDIDNAFRNYTRSTYQTSAFIRLSNTYPWLSKDGGNVDLFRVFLERDTRSLRRNGRVACVVPSGFYVNLNCQSLRRGLLDSGRIQSLIVNPNERFAFPIHHAFKPAFLVAVVGETSQYLSAAFFTGKDALGSWLALDLPKLEAFLAQKNGLIDIPVELIRRISPETFAFVEVHDRADVALLEHLLKNGIPFEKAWEPHYCREIDMTIDSEWFVNSTKLELMGAKFDGMRWHHPTHGEYWPVVEGKHVYQFEFPVGEFRYWVSALHARDLPHILGRAVNAYPRLVWRNVASSTNERSVISTLVPSRSFLGNSLQSVAGGVLSDEILSETEVIFNSFLFDWQARIRGGTNLTHSTVGSLIVPADLDSLRDLRSAVRAVSEANVFASVSIPFDLAEHVMAGFPLLDRLEPKFDEEQRSTMTRDQVLAAYGEKLRHPKAAYYRERANKAEARGARAFVPATRAEAIADEESESEFEE